MSPFDPLLRELDEWNFSGEEATFWWRDDDAQKSSPALIELADLSRRYGVPIGLAVIPIGADSGMWDVIADYPDLTVLQHGYQHRNHAPVGEKKQELGNHRARKIVLNELEKGFRLLDAEAKNRNCPVLVPPWNRISPDLYAGLEAIGFKGLSCFGAREVAQAATDLWIVNTHVDVVNWKQGKKFSGDIDVVAQFITHLKNKRLGVADKAEPTGLLTHHLVHDDACWAFLDELLAILDDHPAVTWLSAERVFQSRWR